MQITLTSKEFDEAVSLWLKEQGFTTDRYDIAIRVIVGRGDSGAGTRVEVTLEQLSNLPTHLGSPISWEEAYELAKHPTKKFGVSMPMEGSGDIPSKPRFGQGHADE